MRYLFCMLLLAAGMLLPGCSEEDKAGAEEVFGRIGMRADVTLPEKGGDLYASWLYLAPGASRVYGNDLFAKEVIELKFANPGRGTRVGLEMQDCGIAAATRVEKLTGKEDSVSVAFPVAWKPERLRTWKTAGPVELCWKVTMDGVEAGEYKKSFTCHPVETCVVEVKAGRETLTTRAMYAGYMEEDNPECYNFIREALSFGIVSTFLEYQYGLEMVKEQLFAFWCVLESKGIRVTGPGEGNGQGVRDMRPLGRVLEEKGGSVEDVTLLFLALCQRIGLCTTLETRPDGVYVGIADNFFSEDPGLVYFLDMTRLSGYAWEDGLSVNELVARSRVSFEEALSVGASMYEQDEKARSDYPSLYEELWLDAVRLHVPSLQLFQD